MTYLNNVCKNIVQKLNLNLSGLTVVTECASGNYAYTPVLAALAGAKVYALGRDTRFGLFSDNQITLSNIMNELELDITILAINEFKDWREADIITNSGMLRPLKGEIIELLKPTAVVPLMWETWEFRSADLDLAACQKHRIAVVGTNENFHQADMYAYPGLMALKMLFDLRAEVANAQIFLLGGGLTGSLIARTFDKLNVDYDWFTATGNEKAECCFSYLELYEKLSTVESLEAIVVAEHTDSRLLIGQNGITNFSLLKEKFPFVKVGHICGNIDVDDLKSSGLDYYPTTIAPYGYMSFLPDVLSPYPVLILNAAGLKVGELAARARLSGKSIEESIKAAVDYGIGQDFEGGFLNYKIKS